MASALLARAARATAKLLAASRRSTLLPVASALPRPVAAVGVPRNLSSARTGLPPAPVSAPAPSPQQQQQRRSSCTTSAVSAAMPGPTAKVALEPERVPTVACSSSNLGAWEGDLLILAVPEDDFVTEAEVTSLKSDSLKALDASLGGVLAEIVAAGGFEGKQGSQSRVVRVGSVPGAKAKYLGLVGLGKAAKSGVVAADWGASAFQALGNAVATMAKAQKAVSVGVAVMAQPEPAVRPALLAQLTTGALLGGYESARFKSKKSPTATKMEALHVLMEVEPTAAAAAIKRGVATAKGNLLTRYLVEAPPNVCTPAHIAEAAKHIADSFKDVMSLQVLEEAECKALGMGCYLGVSEASEEPPKFVHLKYSPKGGSKRKIAIIGKGLTFDSGGYNLKAGPGSMIEMMKFDMGGSGATLGAARIIAELAPADVEIHFIIAACENMVAGKGLRPGDILTSAAGKTVEVNNTDAEGRLTLCDAMWYAQEKCGVSAMVDIATLTGAIMVALGSQIAGLFTPSDTMAAQITAASKAAGEKVWRMPMEQEYADELKSPVADMRNTGSRLGGAITAALFLQKYVKEGVEWAHIDIAGPVWNEKAGLPTGYGAALLAEWAMAQAAVPETAATK